jgi:hypothetical protein
LGNLYYEPIIEHVYPTQHNYDERKNIAYYDLSITVKNVPSDWDFRETMFDALKNINVEDIQKWCDDKNIKVKLKKKIKNKRKK